MKYNDLSDNAKENAIKDYCDLMKIFDLYKINKVKQWLENLDREIFLSSGLLKHRKR